MADEIYTPMLRCKKNTTDLTAEVLAKAGETLLVEAQQREDLEKPFHLRKVNCSDGFIQLLRDNDLQFLLCLLKHYQTGIHSTACADMMICDRGSLKIHFIFFFYR